MSDLPIPAEVLAGDAPPLTDEQLAVFLGDEDSQEFHPDVARWQIDGENTAAWAMAHVGAAEVEAEAIDRQADLWVERIEAWRTDALKRPEATARFFRGHLERWALTVREQSDGKRKSVKLPSGTVTTREGKAPVRVVDADAVLAWADTQSVELQDEVIVVKRSVSLSGLQKVGVPAETESGWALALPDGELVPGVAVDPPATTAKVTPALPALSERF